MNHYILGVFLFLLGLIIFVAGMLRWEIWIFTTAQEERFQRAEGDDTVFYRRKAAGIMGIVIGVIVMLYGDF